MGGPEPSCAAWEAFEMSWHWQEISPRKLAKAIKIAAADRFPASVYVYMRGGCVWTSTSFTASDDYVGAYNATCTDEHLIRDITEAAWSEIQGGNHG
jgi:hypothetical protein